MSGPLPNPTQSSADAPAHQPAPAPGETRAQRLLLLAFPLAALLLLWEALLGGRVLLPADYLKGMAPWSALVTEEALRAIPQWNVLQWDGMAEFYPWRLHAARSMASGQIPLWNPCILAGTPFLANSQSAPLYPLHAIYYLPLGASVAVRMAWVAFLHLSLAGWFAYLLARDLRVSLAPAVVAGLAYELSGFAVAWLELPSFISVSCWIPLVLLCLGRAVRLSSARWTAWTAVALGMMLLAGHLQIAFYGLIAAACWWLTEAVDLVRAGRSDAGGPSRFGLLLPAAGRGLAALVGGLALAAPQVLPSMELARLSHRAGGPTAAGYAGYVDRALPVQNWITLLVPDYYGLPARNDFWGMWEYLAPNVMEYAGHVGGAAFLLALVGLIWGRRITPRVWALAGLAVLTLLIATGTPLNRLFYFYLPGFAQSGSPARILVLLCFTQALLAGLGLEWLLRKVAVSPKGIALPLGVGLGVTAALLAGLHALAQANLPFVPPPGVGDPVQAVGRTFAFAASVAGGLGLLTWLLRENSANQRRLTLGVAAAVIVGGGSAFLGGTYNLTAAPEMVYPATPLTEALARTRERVTTVNTRWGLQDLPPALLPPNASLAYGWRDAQGYDSLLLGRTRHLLDVLAERPEGAAPLANGNIAYVKNPGSPLQPLLGARWVVSQEPLQRAGLLPADGFPPGPPHVYEDRLAVPEAYTVTDWFTAPDDEGLARLREIGPAGLANTALVAPGPGVLAPNPDTRGLTRGVPAILERRSPQKLVVRAEPADRALLVLVESYAPGWTATVTEPGKPPRKAPIVRVNTAFQGVFVGPGSVTVEWRYEPQSFRVGLFLALVMVAVLVGVIARRDR